MSQQYDGHIFLASGFAAKYPEGGGNFSVPLQWALGLKRLGLNFTWLEIMPASDDAQRDNECMRIFDERLRKLDIPYALLFHREPQEQHDLGQFDFHGMSEAVFKGLLPGSTLLNLSYSIHPPLISLFERRIYCNLDPSEICYWMEKMEMGQSSHSEFCIVALNINSPECHLPVPPAGVKWNTFYPLVDTQFLLKCPRPAQNRITTVGQWYWNGYFEFEGGYRDLSKHAMLRPYMDIPSAVPEVEWELAMHMNHGDSEVERIQQFGWKHVFPHNVVSSPADYYRYIENSLAEFTPVKVDDLTRTGWISDRAAAYFALGRPVITESTGAEPYLPQESGFLWVKDRESAIEAARRVLGEWDILSNAARECAVEYFDSIKNLKKILGLNTAD
ncbi:MAG: hypothetical protein ABI443_05110 [Chthoniobacterales bacterium]